MAQGEASSSVWAGVPGVLVEVGNGIPGEGEKERTGRVACGDRVGFSEVGEGVGATGAKGLPCGLPGAGEFTDPPSWHAATSNMKLQSPTAASRLQNLVPISIPVFVLGIPNSLIPLYGIVVCL